MSKEEYEITCVEQDFFGNISKVKVNGILLQSETILYWLRNERYEFFTFREGKKVYIHPKKNMWYGWFLTSDMNSEKANNLEFLCKCES